MDRHPSRVSIIQLQMHRDIDSDIAPTPGMGPSMQLELAPAHCGPCFHLLEVG